jgi:hypothetical protein
MRTSAVTDIVANIAAIHPAELVCSSQVTDPIVITLDMDDTKGHHHCNISAGTFVVWVSTMTGTVPTDMVIEQIMVILAVETTIDSEIEIYRGAGRAAGQLTQDRHTDLTTAVGLRTTDHAVQAIVATDTRIETDAVSLTEVETTLAGLTRLR